MFSIQKVFDTFTNDYTKNHKTSMQQFKVLNSISNCRTVKLGGHANECDNCGHVSIAYNSCRDRHCPICQSVKREKWRVDRNADLLNIHYFHIVFTVPDSLHPLFYHNQNLMYSALMKSAATALTQLASDKKHLGAQIGLTGILHTWGQTLSYHPHVHFIVPGGGLCPKTNKFKSTSKKFFLPVKVVANVFRGILRREITLLYESDKLIDGHTAKSITSEDFDDLISKIYKKDFVVYAKENFDSPSHVIKYLCQYTHRVAISNHRIVNITSKEVTFKYKDYKDNCKTKLMTLDGPEFIRRFLMHVLPHRFVKIRYYGLFASRNRPTKLILCQQLMNLIPSKKSKDYSALEFLEIFMNIDLKVCPKCRQGTYTKIPLPSTNNLDSS